ncbi:MAG: chorismate mutase [Lachnospiraceae bacterium]
MNVLEQLRQQLDDIDDKIVMLYEERMGLCEKVAHYKKESRVLVEDIDREREKLCMVQQHVTNPNNAQGIQELFAMLLSHSKRLQQHIIEQNQDVQHTVHADKESIV